MRFRIRGSIWTAKFIDQPIDEHGKPVDGCCDGNKKRISVKSNLAPGYKVEVFFHEFGHAVAYELGIDDEDVPTWIEHMLVIGWSKDLVANRKLFGRILIDEKRI